MHATGSRCGRAIGLSWPDRVASSLGSARPARAADLRSRILRRWRAIKTRALHRERGAGETPLWARALLATTAAFLVSLPASADIEYVTPSQVRWQFRRRHAMSPRIVVSAAADGGGCVHTLTGDRRCP